MKRKKIIKLYDRNYKWFCAVYVGFYNITFISMGNATYEADYIIVLGSKVNGNRTIVTHCNIVLIKQLSI